MSLAEIACAFGEPFSTGAFPLSFGGDFFRTREVFISAGGAREPLAFLAATGGTEAVGGAATIGLPREVVNDSGLTL